VGVLGIHYNDHVFRESFDTGARGIVVRGTSVASTLCQEHTDVAKFVFSCQLLSNVIRAHSALCNVPSHRDDDICKIPQNVVSHTTQNVVKHIIQKMWETQVFPVLCLGLGVIEEVM
jgi:hypothetical protein